MSKKIRVKAWWEKDWDGTFKKILKEPAIFFGNNPLTFNEIAKQKIHEIVNKEIRMMCDKHNLIALAVDRAGRKNKEGIKKVRSLIGIFRRTEMNAVKYRKELEKILQ